MIIGLVLFIFAGQSLTRVLIAAELFAIPQPLVFLVVLMTISDSVEYGQLKLGHRDESLTLSVRPLLDKLAGAISNGVVGLTAVVAGMTTGATASSVTGSGQSIFKTIMFGLPIVNDLKSSKGSCYYIQVSTKNIAPAAYPIKYLYDFLSLAKGIIILRSFFRLLY